MALRSGLDPKSSDFTRNAEVMRALVADLKDKLSEVAGGGGKASRAKHSARGKMLARERVDLLIDPGTAFLEFSPMAAYGLYGGGGAFRQHRDRHRPRLGPRMRPRCQ